MTPKYLSFTAGLCSGIFVVTLALRPPVHAQSIHCTNLIRTVIQDIESRADSVHHGTFVYKTESPYHGSVAIDFVLADETSRSLELSRLRRFKDLLSHTDLLYAYSEQLMQGCPNIVRVRFMNYTQQGKVFTNPIGFYRNNTRVDQLRCVPPQIAAGAFIEYYWGQHVCRASANEADPGFLKVYNQ
jgi:hypothetical protein